MPIALAVVGLSVATASCSLAFLRCFWQLKSHGMLRIRIFSFLVFFLSLLGWLAFLRSSGDALSWRIGFERITNLPSGVSPVFPVLFLALGLATWIYSHLARRRLYRLSYLPSSPSALEKGKTHFEKILVTMRATRSTVNEMLVYPVRAAMQVNAYLSFVLLVLLVFALIRLTVRGWPRSLEGTWFDNVYSFLLFARSRSLFSEASSFELCGRRFGRCFIWPSSCHCRPPTIASRRASRDGSTTSRMISGFARRSFSSRAPPCAGAVPKS